MITIHELGHHINSPVSRDDRGFLTLLNWGQLGYWALSCIFYMLICESVSATKSESLFTMIFPTIQLTIFRSIWRQTAMKFFPTFFANKWNLLGPTTPNILHLFKCSFECRVSWQLPCLRSSPRQNSISHCTLARLEGGEGGVAGVLGGHKKWKDTWTEISTVKLSPLQNLSFVLLPAQRRADFYFIVAARTLSFWSF